MGQRVRAAHDIPLFPSSPISLGAGFIPRGYCGTVCAFTRSSVGVYWDNNIDGHALGGRCKDGHGWWIPRCSTDIVSCDDDKPWDSSDMARFISSLLE